MNPATLKLELLDASGNSCFRDASGNPSKMVHHGDSPLTDCINGSKQHFEEYFPKLKLKILCTPNVLPGENPELATIYHLF